MRTMVKLGLIVALGGLCFSAGHLVAQEGMGGMPQWMQTTKEHKELQKSVGEWDVNMKLWMAPGAPPMESTGSATMKSVLGGKFIQQDFKGTVMGGPYNGIGFNGFDTVDKKYTSVWMGSMSPVAMSTVGTEADGKTTFTGKNVEFMSGKKQDERQVLTWDGDDKFTFEFFAPGMDGKEAKSMELTYTRKKKAPETPETPK